MKKGSLLILFLLVTITGLWAQDKTVIFDLNVPNGEVVSNSLYNNIDFYDSRPDYEYNQVKIDVPSFAHKLGGMIERTVDYTSKNGILVLQLRNLDYNENKDAITSHIRMNLYAKDSDSYYLIARTDANLGAEDYNKLSQLISQNVSKFISNNLTQTYEDNKTYSFDDLENIDFFEKENIELYNTDRFVDGVYPNIASFFNQNPGITDITPKFKKDELKEIKTPQDGKLKKVNPKDVYAVVVDGHPYIATDKKFIALYFENGDFFFENDETISRVSFSPSFSIGVGSGGYRGGGIGLGVFNQQKKQKVTFMIDHLTGKFIAIGRR